MANSKVETVDSEESNDNTPQTGNNNNNNQFDWTTHAEQQQNTQDTSNVKQEEQSENRNDTAEGGTDMQADLKKLDKEALKAIQKQFGEISFRGTWLFFVRNLFLMIL